jgi:hypothetical protein
MFTPEVKRNGSRKGHTTTLFHFISLTFAVDEDRVKIMGMPIQ